MLEVKSESGLQAEVSKAFVAKRHRWMNKAIRNGSIYAFLYSISIYTCYTLLDHRKFSGNDYILEERLMRLALLDTLVETVL